MSWELGWPAISAIASAASAMAAVALGLASQRRSNKEISKAEQRWQVESSRLERERDNESARRRELEDENRRSQALQVIAWPEGRTEPSPTYLGESRSSTIGPKWYFANFSQEPIFDVSIKCLDAFSNTEHQLHFVPVVEKHGEWEGTLIEPYRKGENDIMVDFRDIRGRWWRRTEKGLLQELDKKNNRLGQWFGE